MQTWNHLACRSDAKAARHFCLSRTSGASLPASVSSRGWNKKTRHSLTKGVLSAERGRGGFATGGGGSQKILGLGWGLTARRRSLRPRRWEVFGGLGEEPGGSDRGGDARPRTEQEPAPAGGGTAAGGSREPPPPGGATAVAPTGTESVLLAKGPASLQGTN